MGGSFEIPEEINPYKVLNISETSPSNIIKNSFRDLITSSNKEKKIMGSLSYDIICNKERYELKNNVFKVKNKDQFYYVVIGDLVNLKKLYENNKDILYKKDEKGRDLLYIAAKNGFYDICSFLLEKGMNPNEKQNNDSTPLHAAAFYNHYNVVKLLLKYYAKTNIKNKYDHTAFDEAYSEKIRALIVKNNNDKINELYKILEQKKLAKKLILVKYNENIIGIKLLRHDDLMPPNITEIMDKWEVAWHGTKYNALESIMKYGLLPSGTILKNGQEIKPLDGHVQYGCKYEDIEDWARAIFVSPSIFYAGHPVYANVIYSFDDTEYSILIETRIKPGSYRKFPPSVIEKLPQKNKEPTFVEYRLEVKDDSNLIIRSESESNVVVYSILFAKTDFLRNIKDYYQGQIFVNSEEEKNLFLT